MISIIIALVIIGAVLALVSMLPIDETIKRIIYILVIVFVIIYLLQSLGAISGGNLTLR